MDGYFFVSSSSTTSTLSTTTVCYSAATTATACGRKRRSIKISGVEGTEASPSPVIRDNEDTEEEKLESGVSERAEDREGRFLLYRMTTASPSTSTSYTATSTMAT